MNIKEERQAGESLWQFIDNNRGNVTTDTAEGIWNKACQYFRWCDENPVTWKTTIMSGAKGGTKVENESPKPYSIRGLCAFCNLSDTYISSIRNSKDQGSDYYVAISKILSIIYVQNFEYAIAGVFNPVFTSKILGFADDVATPAPSKVEIVHTGVPQLSSSENEILQKMEKEKSFQQIDKEQQIKK